jgi:hypothetical protein
MNLHSDVDGWKMWFQVHACARDNTLIEGCCYAVGCAVTVRLALFHTAAFGLCQQCTVPLRLKAS